MINSFSKETLQLQDEILKLKERENVFLMAHYYQRPEVQAIADVLGDSLGLSRIAQKETKSDIIIF
ncbi:MAG: quinolinate synthase NadA, partial [Candidatus Helarchaeota archaeon]